MKRLMFLAVIFIILPLLLPQKASYAEENCVELPILMYHSLLKSKKGKYCVNPSTFEDDILLFLFSDIHFLNIYLHIPKRTTHWRTGLLKLNNISSFKLQNNFKSHLGPVGPVGPCGPAGPVTDGVVTKLTGIKFGLQLLLQQLNMFSPFGDFTHQCILWKKQTKGSCLKFWFSWKFM